MPQFTDEQVKKFMQLDFSTQEAKLAQQQALVNQLRQYALTPGRLDRGSQIARGLSGIGSAFGMAGQKRATEEFGRSKQERIDDIFRKKPEVPILDTPREAYATPGLQDFM